MIFCPSCENVHEKDDAVDRTARVVEKKNAVMTSEFGQKRQIRVCNDARI